MAKAYLDKETIAELNSLSEKDKEKRITYLKEVIPMHHFEPRGKWKRERAVSYTLKKKELKFLENLNRKRRQGNDTRD